MELTGDSIIAAPPGAVWTALNDPDILARCIEGVEALTRSTTPEGLDRLDGKMVAKVGPVRATFVGGVTLTEVDAPRRYVLVGEGKGGVAGFAKGSAEVVLDAVDVDGAAATQLRYTVKSSVGGKLAQLGARLIEGTARGYAETFFARFKAEVETPAAAAIEAAAPSAVKAMAPPAIETVAVNPAAAAAYDPTAAKLTPGIDPAAIVAGDDCRALHANAPRTGLTPLIWGGLLILGVIGVLAWQLT